MVFIVPCKMAASEELRCNICGLLVSSASAQDHASTGTHDSLKRKLNERLEALKSEKYVGDRSVVVQWSSSV